MHCKSLSFSFCFSRDHRLPFIAARLSLLLSLLLGGCALPAKQPQLNAHIQATDLAPGQSLNSQALGDWPDSQWWQTFGDAQLNRLVDQALAGNPSLADAASRVAGAAAAAGLVESVSQPHLGLSASAQPTRFTGQSFIPPPYAREFWWNNSLGLNFRYVLDLWGAEAAADKSAHAQWRATQAGFQAARLSLIASIVQTYSQLAQEYDQRELLEQDLHNKEQLVDISQQRLKAGIGTQLELAQAQTSVPVGQAELDSINLRILLLQHQLAALCGQGPGAGEQLQRPTLSLSDKPLLPSRLPAELLGRRPDIRAQRYQLEAARQGVREARARFYPNLDLVAGVGFESLGFYRFLTEDALVANVGPAMSLPLFDGGARQSQLNARSASYNQQIAEYNATLVRALQQIADQLDSIRALESAQAHIAQAQTLAARAHQLALKGYSAGLTNYVDVLNTETALIAQQQQRVRLQAARLSAQALLIAALGGGFAPEPVKNANNNSQVTP